MMKSIGTAVAGLMFVMGFALIVLTKADLAKTSIPPVRPSSQMLIGN